jgi:NitT/TauT family transport system ATP-binding protein
MDEPFGALDAMTRESLQDEILQLVHRTATTVLFVTHDLDEAIYLGDRVVVMEPNPGRIIASHDVALSHPRNQVSTKEEPGFLALRRSLHNSLVTAHP